MKTIFQGHQRLKYDNLMLSTLDNSFFPKQISLKNEKAVNPDF
jgi:hypothetical protein